MDRLLVTGGCGFIGTNFIRYLLTMSDFKGLVVNVDKLTYAGNPENLKDIQNNFSERYVFHKTDICDTEAMAKIFKRYQIDTICHFAAESHVDRSIIGPADFIQTNILGTFRLLELARENIERFQLFHHVSTDEVYGSLEPGGFFTEDSPYHPNSPYSASKAASDHLVRAYSKTYGLPVTLSNCSNNYGPYQFPEKLIPLTILNALEGHPLPVYGDGRHVRDWLFVTDHCRAVWEIMKHGERGETYIIGGNCAVENIRVVELICDIVDECKGKIQPPARERITFVKDRPGHDRRYAIDFAKLRKSLGWAPEESLASGIRRTVRWYMGQNLWVQRVRSGEYRQWMKDRYDIDIR